MHRTGAPSGVFMPSNVLSTFTSLQRKVLKSILSPSEMLSFPPRSSSELPDTQYVTIGPAYSHICNVVFDGMKYSKLVALLKRPGTNNCPWEAGPLSHRAYQERMWRGSSKSGSGCRDLMAIYFNSMSSEYCDKFDLPDRLTTTVYIPPLELSEQRKMRKFLAHMERQKAAIERSKYDSDDNSKLDGVRASKILHSSKTKGSNKWIYGLKARSRKKEVSFGRILTEHDEVMESAGQAIPVPSVAEVMEDFFRSKMPLEKSSATERLKLLASYIKSYDSINADPPFLPGNWHHVLEGATHNEVESRQFIIDLLPIDDVYVYTTCFLNKTALNDLGKFVSKAGISGEFDMLIVDRATNELALVIEMKRTFDHTDIQKKVASLQYASALPDGIAPFKQKLYENAVRIPGQPELKNVVMPSHKVPILYVCEKVIADPVRDEIKKTASSWLKGMHKRDPSYINYLGFFTSSFEEVSLGRWEPVLEMELDMAITKDKKRGVGIKKNGEMSLIENIKYIYREISSWEALTRGIESRYPFAGVVKLPSEQYTSLGEYSFHTEKFPGLDDLTLMVESDEDKGADAPPPKTSTNASAQ